MRIALFGDGVWATNTLVRLIDDGHQVVAVVLRSVPSEHTLRNKALQNNISVFAPRHVNDDEMLCSLSALDPELNVSVGYNQIVRKSLIDSASLGFINAHAGKLPNYRGRNVINWALINNESEIGITVHYVDEGIDTGDIILQRSIPISWTDTYGSMLSEIQNNLPTLVSDSVTMIESNEVVKIPQLVSEGTYFGGRIEGDEWIDWTDTSLNIYNKIRALTYPGPGARTHKDSSAWIIWKASYNLVWPKYMAIPGQVVGVTNGAGVFVKTGDSTLLIESIEAMDKNEGNLVPAFPIGTRLGVNANELLLRLTEEVQALRTLVEELMGDYQIKIDS